MSQPTPDPPPSPPQPPVAAYQSLPLPPDGKRPWAIGEIISWLVVLLVVAATAVSVALEQRRDAGAGTEDIQVVAAAKYAVGVNELMHSATTNSQLLGELDAAAKTPADRFRVAIVAGELNGKEEALRRTTTLGQESPDLRDDVDTLQSIYAADTGAPPSEPLDPEIPSMLAPAPAPPSVESLNAFRDKWGWFAQIAETTGKPSTDPARQKMLQETYWTLAGIAGLVISAGGGGFLGLTLLIIGLVLLSKGRLVPAYGKIATGVPAMPADRRAYIEGFALFVGIYFGVNLLFQNLFHLPELLQAVVSLVALPTSVLIGLLWPRIRGGTWRQWLAAFGLHRGRGFFREIGAGLLGYIAGLPLVLVGFAITLVLLKFSKVTPTHPIQGPLEHGGPLVIGLIFLLASVWAPITEELLFRGALFSHLRERFGPLFSGIVVGLLFALVHPQGWPLVPVLGSIGFVLTMIREWRGSILGCMTAHALHNTATLLFALMVMN